MKKYTTFILSNGTKVEGVVISDPLHSSNVILMNSAKVYYPGQNAEMLEGVQILKKHIALSAIGVKSHQEYKLKIGDWVNYKGGKWLVAKFCFVSNIMIYNQGGNNCVVYKEDVSPWEDE